ncbi:MAG: HPr family phosphocarrier protein [Halanaerobiales bacterium]
MLERVFLVKNSIGLHARPAALFVDIAGKFTSEINICFGEKEINGKSIISVLSLGLGKGDCFLLQIKGKDEKKAMKELTSFIEENLGEAK